MVPEANRLEGTVLEAAKSAFLKRVDLFGSDPYRLSPHVPEAEKWAKYMLKRYPEANSEVVLVSVWLHDIGHYPLPTDIDHAVRSEEITRRFLESRNYSEDKMKSVLHCVRAHRCRDVQPRTIEAKILAFADSASHMTDSVYFDMASDLKSKGESFEKVYGKINRDFRDLALFPEMQKKLEAGYHTWKKLIQIYEKLDYCIVEKSLQ